MYMAMFIIPIILLTYIRSLRYVSPVSLLANLFLITSLAIIFYYACQSLPPVSTRHAYGSLATFPLYLTKVVYNFECISLIIPLQNNMERPQDFRGPMGILNVGMVIVTILKFSLGFVGYLKYGDAIKGSITLNLPSEAM